jgi:hypothetical protein
VQGSQVHSHFNVTPSNSEVKVILCSLFRSTWLQVRTIANTNCLLRFLVCGNPIRWRACFVVGWKFSELAVRLFLECVSPFHTFALIRQHITNSSVCMAKLPRIMKYEGRLKSSWTAGSASLLCRGRR